MSRVEQWTRDGQSVSVTVGDYETVLVAYPLLAEMLRDLGWSRDE